MNAEIGLSDVMQINDISNRIKRAKAVISLLKRYEGKEINLFRTYSLLWLYFDYCNIDFGSKLDYDRTVIHISSVDCRKLTTKNYVYCFYLEDGKFMWKRHNYHSCPLRKESYDHHETG